MDMGFVFGGMKMLESSIVMMSAQPRESTKKSLNCTLEIGELNGMLIISQYGCKTHT